MSVIAERVTINPATEDTTLQPLDLVGLDRSWGIYLLEHDYTPPDLDVIHSSSADTEGDPVVQSRYLNRTITAKVRVFEPADPAAVNLISNPSAEAASTGYALTKASWTEGTLTREENATFYQRNAGDFALRVKAKKDATVTLRTLTVSFATAIGSVVAGRKYSFSAPVNVIDNVANGLKVRIDWYTAASALISSSAASAAFTETGEQRLSIAGQLAPATASFATLVLEGTSTVSGDTVDFWSDGWQLEEGEAVTPFFDGDTPGCDWTGARHASTATRPAPDGTRFSRICRDVTRILDGIKSRKSGTLRRISALGPSLVFDLRTAKLPDAPQGMGIGMKRAEYGLSFEALPGGRAAEILLATKEEATLPALTMLLENVPGELPGLGRLLVEDKQGVRQTRMPFSVQQDTYTAGADAEAFYQAESRTLLSGSVVSEELKTLGASAEKTVKATLQKKPNQILSTQATGGGNHLAHTGTYRVYARVWRPEGNTGQVTVRLQAAIGDFVNITQNEPITFAANEAEGQWTIVDLGTVNVPAVPAGTVQRWEGRLLASSTVAGDILHVDCFFLQGISEISGEANAATVNAAQSIVGADELLSTGALAGKTATVGGVWAGAGDVDDFTVGAGGIAPHWAARVAISDVAGTPRYELLGATEYTDIAMKGTLGMSPTEANTQNMWGYIVRYVDVNNWLAFVIKKTEYSLGEIASYQALLYKKVAGVVNLINGVGYSTGAPARFLGPVEHELVVLATGDYTIRTGLPGIPNQSVSGSDAVLNAAGALKKGRIGLIDENTAASAATRYVFPFESWVPIYDSVLFPNRQLELRSDRARRQDVTGTTWGPLAILGDYLTIPQAGPEKRVSRLFLKTSRSFSNDAGIDDVKATLYLTPRYLMAPPT